MTNYEKIKQMSVEEMADFLFKFESIAISKGNTVVGMRRYHDLKEELLQKRIDWLESEVEE